MKTTSIDQLCASVEKLSRKHAETGGPITQSDLDAEPVSAVALRDALELQRIPVEAVATKKRVSPGTMAALKININRHEGPVGKEFVKAWEAHGVNKKTIRAMAKEAGKWIAARRPATKKDTAAIREHLLRDFSQERVVCSTLSAWAGEHGYHLRVVLNVWRHDLKRKTITSVPGDLIQQMADLVSRVTRLENELGLSGVK